MKKLTLKKKKIARLSPIRLVKAQKDADTLIGTPTTTVYSPLCIPTTNQQ